MSRVQRLVLLVLAVLFVAASPLLADSSQEPPCDAVLTAPMGENTAPEANADIAAVEIAATDAVALPTTILDQVQQQNSCGCIDLCFSDAQCAMRNGPGSTCEPVGPCACKECLATS